MVYNLTMDKLKVIIEEPSGSRKSFFYNVKSESEANDIVKMVKDSLRPNFSLAKWQILPGKD